MNLSVVSLLICSMERIVLTCLFSLITLQILEGFLRKSLTEIFILENEGGKFFYFGL